MPPSPGHIHQLPVKVLYSLDGSDQSYLTVLSELQDVYIHPGSPSYGTDEEPGPMGSTLLKALAQGVCYASPSSLDFSVYNLDPTPRPPRTTISQPFGTPSRNQGGDEPSWSGKGFLSWAISEESSGSTLVKGRLMKEYDFESSRFAPSPGGEGGGGLEALMRRGGSSDGRGWGLEVVISLKMVNPAGKGEFSGRKEFERMLFQGPGTASGCVLIGPGGASSPVRPVPVRPPASAPPSRGPNGGPPSVPVNGNGNGTAQRAARPPPPINRSSGSSLPPSSMPMAPSSSSQAGPSRPSSASTSAQAQQNRPPLPPSSIGMHASSSTSTSTATATARPPVRPAPALQARPPPPPGSGTKPNTTPPKSQAQASVSTSSRARNREVTPPPLPRAKSPPPTTPHRRVLRDLLQADGTMSPSMARHLASNPALLALLKSMPDTKSESSATTGAATAGGAANGKGKGKAKDVKGDIETGGGNGNGPNSSRSFRDDTPTPTAPKAKVESIPGGCVNCGTMETTMWRVKSYADGTKKKVCDACGLYFNKHKEMRPKELWDTTSKPSSSGPTKRPHPTPPPSLGVRHSPRLSRQAQHPSSDNHPPVPGFPESPSKRRRTSGRPPIQPSPRMATRSTARSDIGVGGKMEPFPFSSPAHSHSNSTPFGFGTSPAVPLDPSHSGASTGNDNGNGNEGGSNHPSTNADDTGIEDMDLDALLAQLTNGSTSNGNGDMHGTGDGMNLNHGGGGLSLEELFATVDNAAATDDALAEDMMRFLAGLEDAPQDQEGVGAADGNGGGNGGSNEAMIEGDDQRSS